MTITNRHEAKENDYLLEYHLAEFAAWAVLNTSNITHIRLEALPERRRQTVLSGVLHAAAAEYLDRVIRTEEER